MAVPQLTGFQVSTFCQFDHPGPPPPLPSSTTTTTTITQLQNNSQPHLPYKDQPQPGAFNHSFRPGEDDLNQPLDLSMSREILSKNKRSVEGNFEEKNVKRAHLEVMEKAIPFSSAAFENGSSGTGGLLAPFSRQCHLQDYSSLLSCFASETGNPVQENVQNGRPPQSLSHFSPSPVGLNGRGLPPYYHSTEDKRGHPPNESEPTVSHNVRMIRGSEMGHEEHPGGISLGLPIPHNSVFTRSVSPLFQQSWHHSPVSVSSYAHHSLLHAPSSFTSHLQPNLFQSPVSASSDGQQSLLHTPSTVPLCGPSDPLHTSSSVSTDPTPNVLPFPQEKVHPLSTESILTSHQEDILPSLQQGVAPVSQHSPLPAHDQILPWRSDSSPRQFYRPFEDTTTPSSSPTTLSTTPTYSHPDTFPMEMKGHLSNDVSPSSSCPLPSSLAYGSPPSPDQTSHESLGDGSCLLQHPARTEEMDAVSRQNEAIVKHGEAPELLSHNSDSNLPGQTKDYSSAMLHEPVTEPKPSSSATNCTDSHETSTASNQNVQPKTKTSPIQDDAVRSTSNTSLALHLSKSNRSRWRKAAIMPCIKVIGTTPLARIREERAKQESQARQDRLRQLLALRQHYQNIGTQDHPTSKDNKTDRDVSAKISSDNANGEESQPVGSNNKEGETLQTNGEDSSSNKEEDSLSTNDSGSTGEEDLHSTDDTISKEGGSPDSSSDDNSTKGANPRRSNDQQSPCSSSDSSKHKADNGAPIPPDPNLKISALDYHISKVLVESIDVPFKPENTEIRAIYTGAKKGRLTLVDLIELQVEASLKA